MSSSSIVTNEDCLALMARTPDKYFELAVVDPPYGAGDIRNCTQLKYKTYKNAIPTPKYFKELERVSKNRVIWGGNYFATLLPSSRGWIFWYKRNPNPKYSDGELAWTSFDETLKAFDYMFTNVVEGLKNISNGSKDRVIHPTQKPVALYSWIFKNYAKAGDKILDTHLGSGSSRIAAYKAGLDFTACELDKDYFEAQEKRFKNFISQEVMQFADAVNQ